MALWQYPLTILPRAGIQACFGYLPERLPISSPGETPLPTDPPTELAADTPNWWAGQRVAAAPLVAALDALLPRASWGSRQNVYWKGDEETRQDHDCHLSLDAGANFAEAFQFRTDLRDPTQAGDFLTAILSLCQQHDLLVLDATGALLPPQLPAVLPFIEQSRAVRFLTNPLAFLEQVLREQQGS